MSDSHEMSNPPILFLLRSHSQAVRAKLISSGVLGTDAYVVVAGPANVYAHYVATREEYGVQRYEGASTIFGPCECYRLLSPSPSAISRASVPFNLDISARLLT